MELVQVDSSSGEYVSHTFIGKDKQSNFDFSFTVSVVEKEPLNLLAETTIQKYEEDCNCKVVDYQEIKCPYFEGARYEILKVGGDNMIFGGLVFLSREYGGRSLNIVSMCLNDFVPKLEKKLDPIINSLVINLD